MSDNLPVRFLVICQIKFEVLHLKRIGAATSNAHLTDVGLSPDSLAKLSDPTAYQRLAREANVLISQNQERIDALKQHIESSHDRAYLHKISICENMEQFLEAIAHPLSTPPLLDTNDYHELIELARKQVAHLATKSHSVGVMTESSPEHSAVGTEVQTEEPVIKFANMLMEENGILQFSEQKVRENELTRDLPAVKRKDGKQALSASVSSIPKAYDFHYKGVHVDTDEAIRAYKVYSSRNADNPTEHQVTGVALLKQECTGTVRNLSYGEFTEVQKTEMALKQAQMLLLNYRPKANNNEIYLTGYDVDLVNKLFAACLVLQEKHPHLKTIKIHSQVPGCTGPKYSLFRSDSSVRTEFIKQHLVPGHLELLSHQVAQTTDMRFKRFKEMNDLVKHELDEYRLKEDDTVDGEGGVARKTL